MAGQRDLQMAAKRAIVADLRPLIREDTPALRTTPFQGGEDDEGIPVPHVVPLKEEVKPNFRTPPS